MSSHPLPFTVKFNAKTESFTPKKQFPTTITERVNEGTLKSILSKSSEIMKDHMSHCFDIHSRQATKMGIGFSIFMVLSMIIPGICAICLVYLFGNSNLLLLGVVGIPLAVLSIVVYIVIIIRKIKETKRRHIQCKQVLRGYLEDENDHLFDVGVKLVLKYNTTIGYKGKYRSLKVKPLIEIGLVSENEVRQPRRQQLQVEDEQLEPNAVLFRELTYRSDDEGANLMSDYN